jgi:Fe-S-cluster containining protein
MSPVAGFGGCTGCEGRCCRQYLVPLTCLDVHALSRALALAPERFAELVPDADPDGIRFEPGGETFSIVLVRRDPAAERPPCVFLMELPGGAARCGVYADRPLACRAFPMTPSAGGVAVLPGVPCPPGSWERAVHAWAPTLRRAASEAEAHRRIVASWNARVDAGTAEATPSGFFGHAMAACDTPAPG